MKPRKNQLQQGDVWIEKASIPKDAPKLENYVLAEGEGHHLHRFAVPADVEVYEKNGIRFARVKKTTTVEHVTVTGLHGEHRPLTVQPGEYRFGQVQEYDYFKQMTRAVID